MKLNFNTWGPATVLMCILATVIVGGGVVVSAVNPDTYSFSQLLDDLKTFAVGVGALSIGRGLATGLTNAGALVNLPGVSAQVPGADPNMHDELAEHLEEEPPDSYDGEASAGEDPGNVSDLPPVRPPESTS